MGDNGKTTDDGVVGDGAFAGGWSRPDGAVIAATAQIASTVLGFSQLTDEVIAASILAIRRALTAPLADPPTAAPTARRPPPAVAIEDSVLPEHIVCLEDGKKLKMLKRHLRTAFNMTPEEYRERWDLPADYPMVAPNYAATRATLAKASGLGKRSVAA